MATATTTPTRRRTKKTVEKSAPVKEQAIQSPDESVKDAALGESERELTLEEKIAKLPTEGIHDGIDESLYHADTRSISSTGIKTLYMEGPRVFRYKSDHPSAPKEAFDLGSVAHALILGVGEYEVLDYPAYTTKAAKEARDAARAAGKTPILVSQYELAEAMADAVKNHPVASMMCVEGKAEQSAWATDPQTGVLLRGRFDYLRSDCIIDVKTTSSAGTPEEFGKAVASYRYDMQAAHYLHLAQLNGVRGGELLPFYWLVVSTNAPHEVYVYQADTDLLNEGFTAARNAYESFASCQYSGVWPGKYDDNMIYRVQLPKWWNKGQ